MNGIYDSALANAIQNQELARWRGIHRKPARPYRRLTFTVAAVLAVGAITPLNAGRGVPTVVSIAATPAQAAVPTEVFDRATTVSRSTRVATSRTTRINRAINFALAQRGDRYRWGAMGPSRWDCSGLVKKSFAKAGVSLPHYTGGIQRRGKYVSKRNLRRGDIIFPQRGHVGIYLGNNRMVHASSGQGRVVVARVYGYYTARRVL